MPSEIALVCTANTFYRRVIYAQITQHDFAGEQHDTITETTVHLTIANFEP